MLLLSMLVAGPVTAGVLPSGPDYEKLFTGFRGCFVLATADGKVVARHNVAQCAKRFAPCSTFKIPNALIGLETGVLGDESTRYVWDRTPQAIKSWESDHTLASAMEESVVWYFQKVASGIGEERMRRYLQLFDYGNRDISGGLTKFWLSSSLRVSAEEQVAFLKKLYTGKLPVTTRTASIVEKLLVKEKGATTLSGKTGSCGVDDGQPIGWFVGHLRKAKLDYFFAANILGPEASGSKAQGIVRTILTELALMSGSIAHDATASAKPRR